MDPDSDVRSVAVPAVAFPGRSGEHLHRGPALVVGHLLEEANPDGIDAVDGLEPRDRLPDRVGTPGRDEAVDHLVRYGGDGCLAVAVGPRVVNRVGPGFEPLSRDRLPVVGAVGGNL